MKFIAPQRLLSPLSRYARLLAISAFVVACGGGDGGDGDAPEPGLVAITIVGIPATPMTPGQKAQLSARVRDPDGSLRDVTASVAWSSTDTSVLAVSGAAVMAAAAPGRAEVIATGSGASGRAGVRVSLDGARLAISVGELWLRGNADGPGTAARFNNPGGVAVDGAGNVYVADTSNHTIRKITAAGDVGTFAGAGLEGSTDGAGGAVRFRFPSSVAVDGAGNVYVADTRNQTIRRITPSGDVSTLAGTAGQNGSVDGLGSAARFSYPSGVATDSVGNVYVADTTNNTIRKISPAGEVSTLAGTAGQRGSVDGIGAAARFSGPYGLAADSAGNLYVAEEYNFTIRKVSPAGEVITLAGKPGQAGSADGPGAAARFDFPLGVAIDAAGSIYVADSGSATIRKVSPVGEVITLAGAARVFGSADGVGPAARFSAPSGLAVDSVGHLYIADSGNSNVRGITATGTVSTLAGATPALSGSGSFGNAAGLAVDGVGNIYVAAQHRIDKIHADGSAVSTLAGAMTAGSTDGTGEAARFSDPDGVATDNVGNLYVADSSNHTIRKITPAGEVSTLAGAAGQSGTADGLRAAARFNYPSGVATDVTGNVYVADTTNRTIRKITPAGQVSTLAGTAGQSGTADGIGAAARFSSPRGLATDSAGNVYAADGDKVRKVTPVGEVTTLAVVPSVMYSVALSGAAVDADGNVYVSDTFGDNVRKVTPAGGVTLLAGDGGTARLSSPRGLATDSAGNLYVAAGAIRKIAPTGVVSTVAGRGVAVQVDGPIAVARFVGPTHASADAAGNIYVAEDGGAVRMIAGNGTVSTLRPYYACTSGTAIKYGLCQSITAIAADGAGGVYFSYSNRVDSSIGRIDRAGKLSLVAGGPQGSADGPAGAARFGMHVSIAAGSNGVLYVADTTNHTLRKITPAGEVTTLAGTAGQSGSADGVGAAARFSRPFAPAVDSAGNIYVADRDNSTLRKVTPAGAVSTFAGSPGRTGYADGLAEEARFAFGYPVAMTVDSDNNLYVLGDMMVRKISPAGVVTTVAGKAGVAGFRPGGVPGLLGARGLTISGASLYATYDDVIVVMTNVR
jgi:sugar lactone lactonase YvrE